MTVRRRLIAGLLVALLLGGWASLGEPAERHDLIAGLDEISGLAVANRRSVLAHNDEHGIVYQLDLETGRPMRAFALGDPTEEGDFEGIAVRGNRVYLVTSHGEIYEAPVGAHRERVSFNTYDTGVGDDCEVEGLSRGPSRGDFLMLCKRVRGATKAGGLRIYRWSLADRMPETEPWLDVDVSNILTDKQARDFRPSAIEWVPREGRLYVVSASANVMIMLGPDGTLLGKRKLPKRLHAQAEGLTLMPDGRIVVADEKAEQRRATLTVYAPVE